MSFRALIRPGGLRTGSTLPARSGLLGVFEDRGEVAPDRHRFDSRHVGSSGVANGVAAESASWPSHDQPRDLPDHFGSVSLGPSKRQHRKVDSEMGANPWLGEDVGILEELPCGFGVSACCVFGRATKQLVDVVGDLCGCRAPLPTSVDGCLSAGHQVTCSQPVWVSGSIWKVPCPIP